MMMMVVMMMMLMVMAVTVGVGVVMMVMMVSDDKERSCLHGSLFLHDAGLDVHELLSLRPQRVVQDSLFVKRLPFSFARLSLLIFNISLFLTVKILLAKAGILTSWEVH